MIAETEAPASHDTTEPQEVSDETHYDAPPAAEPVAEPPMRPEPVHPRRDERHEFSQRRHEPADRQPRHQEPPQQEFKTPAITEAIDQVTKIIEELKTALNEMEEVLETLELAERQKIDDEREIEALQRALRQLRQHQHGGGQHRR